MATVKKIFKIVGIIAAIAAAVAGIYFAVTKFLDKKKSEEDVEDYVSCSCFDDAPIAVVAE